MVSHPSAKGLLSEERSLSLGKGFLSLGNGIATPPEKWHASLGKGRSRKASPQHIAEAIIRHRRLSIIFLVCSRLSAAGTRGWRPAAAFVSAFHRRSAVHERLPAPKSNTPAPTQTAEVSPGKGPTLVWRSADRDFQSWSGTGLAVASLKNKLSEALNESYHVQIPYGVEMRHYPL